MALKADTTPIQVDCLDGEVVMTGRRVAIALTPSAAAETARRLSLAAAAADRQASPADASQESQSDA